MILKTDSDYVEFFAKKIREDNSIFKQQKMLLESQMKSSRDMFRMMFGTGAKFRAKARKYLKAAGRI